MIYALESHTNTVLSQMQYIVLA